MKTTKVVQYGVGPIGLGIVDVLLARPWIQLVGAIDTDKNKVGKDVGQLLSSPRRTGVTVSDKAEDVLKKTKPDIVTHATSSYMKTIQPQIAQIIETGTSVVSTAEELSYPFVKSPQIAAQLDEQARNKNAVILGPASTQASYWTRWLLR